MEIKNIPENIVRFALSSWFLLFPFVILSPLPALLLLFLLKPVFNFLLTPLFRDIGLIRYCSKNLFVTKNWRGVYEIHFLNIYEAAKIFTRKRNKRDSRKELITDFITGIINLPEADNWQEFKSHTVKYTGSFLFLSEKTLSRFQFSVYKPGLVKRLLFIADYVNLLLLGSISQNRVIFPKLRNLKIVSFDSAELNRKRPMLQVYINSLNRQTAQSDVA